MTTVLINRTRKHSADDEEIVGVKGHEWFIRDFRTSDITETVIK